MNTIRECGLSNELFLLAGAPNGMAMESGERMGLSIGRVCAHAKPAQGHPIYEEWETADVVVFVRANDEATAISRARDALCKEKWQVLSIDLCDCLDMDSVREQGGQVWELYQRAASTGVGLKVMPRHFAAGSLRAAAMRPPRVNEAFMDSVVHDIGGERLLPTDTQRIADYRIANWIFEMKDLQNDGLLEPQRQAKLAALFAPHIQGEGPHRLQPGILSKEERQRQNDILGGPNQNAVKSASKQIRSTKAMLGGNAGFKGGLIYLNTGFGSLPPEDFGPLVERYVTKDTTQIEAVFCVSTWCVTNGFDYVASFLCHPSEPQHAVVREMRSAFHSRFEAAMTQVVTGAVGKVERASPLKPVVFTSEGVEFSWEPPGVPFSWNGKK